MQTPTEDDFLELATSDGATIRVRRRLHPRARRLRLTVTAAGAHVTCPKGVRMPQILAFVSEHGDWIARKLGEMHLDVPAAPLRVGQDSTITLRGEMLDLLWLTGEWPKIERIEDQLQITLPARQRRAAQQTARALLRSYLEAQVRRDIARWLGQYCPMLGAAPTGFRIRPLKSLWGSLDTRNTVSLDLALALAPPSTLRYVLIHELCHLKVRNHSPRFWRQVEMLYPNWHEQRDWLRINGQAIKAELVRLVSVEN
ncbi:MAG: SprT family zinc-dependent metalloprotease [Dokdonella sp.]